MTQEELDTMTEHGEQGQVKLTDPAFCHHEPNLDAKVYHKTGWRAPCAKCGVMLDIQPRLMPTPGHKPNVHMSKKDRLMRRKMPLFVKEEKAETTVVKPIMNRGTRKRLQKKQGGPK